MRKWYPPVLVALAFLASAIAYPKLPDEVPIHWDLHGRVNGYGSRFVGVFIMPLAMLGIWALMRALPKIDPHHENYAKMQRAYDVVVYAALTVIGAVHGIVLAAMFGAPISMERLMPALIGVMLIVVGNVLPQARPNWFFGIRTPWTLSNDRVWERTHRVGGYLMVVAGVVGIITAALPFFIAFTALWITTGIAAVGSIVYSYIAWKQETSSGGLSK